MRGFRKPLVVFTPKIGLRSPHYVSNLSSFSDNSSFLPIIPTQFGKSEGQSVIFCTGQIFIQINRAVENYIQNHKKQPPLTLIRIEELAPFPEKEILTVLREHKYSDKSRAVWIQEESMNMGAFTFVQPSLNRIIKMLNISVKLEYFGRDSQCGANGCVDDHKMEYTLLMEKLDKFIHDL